MYKILKGLVDTRETLRPYVKEQMVKAHEKGTPVIRPLFYDNPDDEACWDVNDEYMFGPDILVAPVLYVECVSVLFICRQEGLGKKYRLEKFTKEEVQ